MKGSNSRRRVVINEIVRSLFRIYEIVISRIFLGWRNSSLA